MATFSDHAQRVLDQASGRELDRRKPALAPPARWTPEELKSAYERSLERDICTNAEKIAQGRTDLIEYDRKCRAELAALRAATKYKVVRGVPIITE